MIIKKLISNHSTLIYDDTEYNRQLDIVGHLAIVVDYDVYLGVMTRCGGYEGKYVYYLANNIQLVEWKEWMDMWREKNVDKADGCEVSGKCPNCNKKINVSFTPEDNDIYAWCDYCGYEQET